jgi:hypothetical protein
MANPKRSIPEISVDARLLYERLKQVGVGETIRYEELDAVVDRDVRNGAHGVMTTARRRAQNIDQIVFGTIRGVGLKRLNDAEIVDTGQSQIDAVRRRARRAFTILTCVSDFDALPAESKVKHNTYASMFSVLSNVTKPGQIKKVEQHVERTQAELPLARVLEALSK